MTTTEMTVQERASADMRAASEVSRRVQIHEIKLVSCNARYDEDSTQEQLNYDMRFKTNTELVAETKNLKVHMHFALMTEPRDENSTSSLFIEAQFLLTYVLDSTDGLDSANYQSFGELNGRFNAWPYWREFVQSITVRMGIPPLTVPSLKITGTDSKVEPNSDATDRVVKSGGKS